MSKKQDDEGPEFDVWNYLWQGYDAAYEEMSDGLGSKAAKTHQIMGEAVVQFLGTGLVSESSTSAFRSLKARFPSWSAKECRDIGELLVQLYQDDARPWLRHAVELEIASLSLERATSAFDRFRVLSHVLIAKPIGAEAERYVTEVIQAFLMGFDAAAIALARAAFEQLGRRALVNSGAFPSVRRVELGGKSLLDTLKDYSLLGPSYANTVKLIKRADTVMHRNLFDAKVSRQLALDSIQALLAFASDLDDR
jgi:hypothetical protein